MSDAMKTQNFYKDHSLDLSLVEEASFNPYYPVINSGLNETLDINGTPFVDLASNNYLGLANDPRVKRACQEAISRFGVSMCATPVASGYSALHHELEFLLSRFTGLESTLIYPSCYQANNGLFPAITGREDIALIDRFAHSSLIEGVKASGCKMWPFIHNDMNHLEKILKKVGRYRRIFVITESVFSTEGSIASFKEIVALCEKYDAIPVIDDSHGIGVLGKTGRGILEHLDIHNFQGIYTASLGKAIANAGGIIAGKKSLIDYLRYYSSHLVYSTSILPVVLAGVRTVLEIIGDEFTTLSNKLWANTAILSESLKRAGFDIQDSKTPIVSIRSGNSLKTLEVAKTFFGQQLLVTPFVFPSVRRSEGRIRLIAGANLSSETMKKVADAVRKLENMSV